ncbi:MAG: 30S ribosomal protein S12 methylthiotransferase RimO [Desulfobacterales bacterium]|jgi:ribosomal protein S12 methylthiotransferase
MIVHLTSLGCARNQIDSEVMLGRLKEVGALFTDTPGDAEVIIVNTCSFIESAADESIDTILELATHKNEDRRRRLIVTGCLPERYRQEITKAIPEVDVFLGTGAFDRIVEAVEGHLDTAKCLLPDPDSLSPSGAGVSRERSNRWMAYVKIAEGCSRQCTYCIIPRLRGRRKSRSIEDVAAEARQLVQSGVRELVLVSQETTAYGKDLQPPADLARLLTTLATLPDVSGTETFWIRFLYGHPESIDDRLMNAVAQNANICSYFDIPIQHASRSILKKMGRHYGPDDLRLMLERIRRLMPEAALRTTVIVGFPGETDADFDELLRFVESERFNHLGCFVYSDSEDLPSHRLPDHVPAEIARERHRILMKRQQKISAARNREYKDQKVAVLVEEHQENGLYTGRTEFQAPEVDGVTYIHADRLQTGCFAMVRITDTLEYDLVGEAV